MHPSTVSRALNAGAQRLSPQLVSRVVAAAKELGYRPNGLARALRLERSSSIGMLIPDISNPTYPSIVRGVEDALRPAGVSVLLASTDNDLRQESELMSVMVDHRVDGLLLATVSREYPLLQTLLETDVPVVLINRGADDLSVPIVGGDDDKGIQLAVEHLKDLGHRHIAHLAGTDSVTTGYHRRRAFVRAVQENGLPFDPRAVVSADSFDGPVGLDLGAALCEELLRRNVEFTAVVAANDLFAVSCYDVFKTRGIRIPQDVSVIGYNDVLLIDRLNPPLTTIRNPHYDIGLRAGRAILERIAGDAAGPMRISLMPSLVVRASTAPPSATATTRRAALAHSRSGKDVPARPDHSDQEP